LPSHCNHHRTTIITLTITTTTTTTSPIHHHITTSPPIHHRITLTITITNTSPQVFVAYNKVVTAQYFTWYLCLLPLCLRDIVTHVPIKPLLLSIAFYILAMGLWLHEAWRLEFVGGNTFATIWLCGLAFHIASAVLIALVVWYTPSSVRGGVGVGVGVGGGGGGGGAVVDSS
jgi:hypothetical protein